VYLNTHISYLLKLSLIPQYCPVSYASDIASSFEDSSDSYTLPIMSVGKTKRHRRKSKLTPLTYEDFTYQKKSPIYVIS